MTKPPLTRHPLSAAMFDMEADAFMALQESIGKRGVMEPVVLFQGQVLDGWNRYNAACGMNVECVFTEFKGDYPAAIEFVWDKHGTRRNWSEGQRALVQVELSRQRSLHPVQGQEPPKPTAREEAAAAGVSERTIQQARVVAAKAVDEVKQAVMDGSVSLKTAEKLAQLPRRVQPKALVEQPAPGAGRKKWTPAEPPKPQVGASLEALTERDERIAILVEENDWLTLRVGLDAGQYTEEERAITETLVAELRAEVATLTHNLASMADSRDTYMKECAELRKQCGMYRNQLARRA